MHLQTFYQQCTLPLKISRCDMEQVYSYFHTITFLRKYSNLICNVCHWSKEGSNHFPRCQQILPVKGLDTYTFCKSHFQSQQNNSQRLNLIQLVGIFSPLVDDAKTTKKKKKKALQLRFMLFPCLCMCNLLMFHLVCT